MAHDLVDVLIVGAGPAGMAAACEARRHGLHVTVLDEQASPGGQIYRGVDQANAQRRALLGEDYVKGLQLTQAFAQSGAHYLPEATVWNISQDLIVHFIHQGSSQAVQARHIILASGAMERPFPIPGWTLPGVMSAGAAQILLKTTGAIPSEPVVLAGCGPLLYLLATQYLRAGVQLKAVVHTTKTEHYVKASSQMVSALSGWRDLAKGMRMLAQLRRHHVSVYAGANHLRIEGQTQAQALSFIHQGKTQRIATPLILLHQGVVPNTQLSWSLRTPHDWNAVRACWEPKTEDDGHITNTGIYIVGDSRGIVGAQASATQGQLAAIRIAKKLGRHKTQGVGEATVRKTLQRQLRIRPFLDTLYPPLHRVPADDDVIVCRCEEVTAGQIRQYVATGCHGPNQTKAFGRCGMGPCQGRLCGLTVTELIAKARGVSPEHVGYYRIRPPIKPVTLRELVAEAPSKDYRSALSLIKGDPHERYQKHQDDTTR